MIDRPPLVSVIMSAYNSKSTIGESIESILSQSYQNIELLICNDGSTDDTQKILNSFQKKDSRVRLFQNPKNLGLTASLNILIAESKGVFIARQDADVILERRYNSHKPKAGALDSSGFFYGLNPPPSTVGRQDQRNCSARSERCHRGRRVDVLHDHGDQRPYYRNPVGRCASQG